MEDILFIKDECYQGGELTFSLQPIPFPILYSVSIPVRACLRLKLYETYKDFEKGFHLCQTDSVLISMAQYDEETISAALSVVAECTMLDLANKYVMEFLSRKIGSDASHVYIRNLARYVSGSFDIFVRECVEEFAKTYEGKEYFLKDENSNI